MAGKNKLTASHIRYLLVMKRLEQCGTGVRSVDLASELGVSKPSIHVMLNTLCEMQYLPWFCVGIMAAILAALTLIGYLSVRQMLKGTAADALRPYTPKRMKKLLLERTALWEKLGFGTRWNLRDSMRHKSRTLMSLLGVVGCAIIVVASLGMSDTMDAFLQLYYDEAIHYNSRIHLSEQEE